MKKSRLFLLVLAVSISAFFAFARFQGGSIKGTITPAAGAKFVWVLSPTDTLKALVHGGAFTVNNVKAGSYKVVIVGNSPYKDAVKVGVQVADGQATDLKETKLAK